MLLQFYINPHPPQNEMPAYFYVGREIVPTNELNVPIADAAEC